MNTNGQFHSWQAFLQALRTRFAPSQYKDLTRTLCKLTQKGTASQYLSEFEDIANRIIGLPSPFLLSCFISGLAPDIWREVQAHQPVTLVQAAGLARLQEEKILDTRQPPRPRPSFQPQHNPRLLSTINTQPLPPSLPPPPRVSPPPVKRLSPEEIAYRREHGLYFTCEEKFHRGHCYASRVFSSSQMRKTQPLLI